MIDLSLLDRAAYGSVLRMKFEFEQKEFVSGNHTHKTSYRAGLRYKTTEAKRQDERLSREAAQFALSANWAMPDYVRIEAVAVNLDTDWDNLKPLWDSLQGIAYSNDRRIKQPSIYLVRDKGPIRIYVAIQAIDGKIFGFPKPSKRKEPRVL